MKKSAYAVASLVIGILSFIDLFGIEKAIAAGIFGILALKEIKTTETKSKSLAYAGIALGTIYIIILAILFAIRGPELISLLFRKTH
jgi:hypothetical protein